MEKLCKIRDIQRAVNQFEQGFEKRYGICLNEGMALCSLLKAGSLSSGEIGELLGLSSSNASKVIKSIENKRLVERATGEKDKRQMYFSLTPDGPAVRGNRDRPAAERDTGETLTGRNGNRPIRRFGPNREPIRKYRNTASKAMRRSNAPDRVPYTTLPAHRFSIGRPYRFEVSFRPKSPPLFHSLVSLLSSSITS